MWEAFQVGMVAHKGASLNRIGKWPRTNDVLVIISVWMHPYSHPMRNQVKKHFFNSKSIECTVMSAFNMWSHWAPFTSSNGPGKDFFNYFLSTNMVHAQKITLNLKKILFHLEFEPNRTCFLIDITCESDIKGMAMVGRKPSFHCAEWSGGFPVTSYSKFSPLHWRLSTVLLQLLPVEDGSQITEDSSHWHHMWVWYKRHDRWRPASIISWRWFVLFHLLIGDTPTFVFTPLWHLSEWVTTANSCLKKGM